MYSSQRKTGFTHENRVGLEGSNGPKPASISAPDGGPGKMKELVVVMPSKFQVFSLSLHHINF
jgi:hypothetical protein